MLRPSSTAQIWTEKLEKYTRCSEQELVEIVLRLRLLHWNVESSAMKNILQRYTADTHYALADTQPLPYRQLRFDTHVLPKLECELPDYSVQKSAVKPVQSANLMKMR